MIQTFVLCIIGIAISTAGFMWPFTMNLYFWGEDFPNHLMINSISLGLSCSAVLLSFYNWKTAAIVVRKERGIFVFSLTFFLASIGGYLFEWFVWLAPIFHHLFLSVWLFCISFFALRITSLRYPSFRVSVRAWRVTSIMFAIVSIGLVLRFWLPFWDWLCSGVPR